MVGPPPESPPVVLPVRSPGATRVLSKLAPGPYLSVFSRDSRELSTDPPRDFREFCELIYPCLCLAHFSGRRLSDDGRRVLRRPLPTPHNVWDEKRRPPRVPGDDPKDKLEMYDMRSHEGRRVGNGEEFPIFENPLRSPEPVRLCLVRAFRGSG